MIEQIEKMVSERSAALREGNAAKAASIEGELSRYGVVLRDDRHGTHYKIG